MKKELNKEIMNGLKMLTKENALWGYMAAKRIYRADCVCHLVHLPFNFKKW